ncbi:MAG: hypothetical protein MK179_20440 [Pirellulaceae bacterium]|nr:hypothetical protein [Pirellulaceae bacterium]
MADANNNNNGDLITAIQLLTKLLIPPSPIAKILKLDEAIVRFCIRHDRFPMRPLCGEATDELRNNSQI